MKSPKWILNLYHPARSQTADARWTAREVRPSPDIEIRSNNPVITQNAL